MLTLKENDVIGGYSVKYLIKTGTFNSTYRIADSDGKSFFMKFFDVELVPAKLIEDGEIREIAYSRKVKHHNVISYVTDGSVTLDGKECKYLITDYFVGKLLSESLNAGQTYSLDSAQTIIVEVLAGISFLHSLGLSHNDITPRNIILEEGEEGRVPKIIDLGHLSPETNGAPPFMVDDLTPAFCAPETFVGLFRSRADSFSAMAVFYYLLSGKVPWPYEAGRNEPLSEIKRKAREARKWDLDLQALKDKSVPDDIIELIKKGLSFVSSTRPDVDDLLSALSRKDTPVHFSGFHPGRKQTGADETEDSQAEVLKSDVELIELTKAKGGGFADVAGMGALKAELTNRVIWVLKNKDKAKEYKLSPPNGMILYGPPGCGKTFFAQKFAEESQFNFTLVNGSDLGSIYVHGTQGKIADLFKEAQKNPPAIICFDEFDAFVPSRESSAADHKQEEVNEFLGQLNNCAQKGIFVIGTTNKIDMIDPAVLRKGRMDLHFLIPPPDVATRKQIFTIHLKDRPVSEDVNYDELAELTDNYASSDIAFIVNEAAMTAAMAEEKISQRHLINSIRCNKSSLAPAKEERTRVGFKQTLIKQTK